MCLGAHGWLPPVVVIVHVAVQFPRQPIDIIGVAVASTALSYHCRQANRLQTSRCELSDKP